MVYSAHFQHFPDKSTNGGPHVIGLKFINQAINLINKICSPSILMKVLSRWEVHSRPNLKFLDHLELYSCNPPGHPSFLLTTSFVLEYRTLCHLAHVDTLPLQIQALFPSRHLSQQLFMATHRLGVGILSALGPDPEKKPVQALEDGSGAFGKEITGSWVPGV